MPGDRHMSMRSRNYLGIIMLYFVFKLLIRNIVQVVHKQICFAITHTNFYGKIYFGELHYWVKTCHGQRSFKFDSYMYVEVID